jgi:hypothetical protein
MAFRFPSFMNTAVINTATRRVSKYVCCVPPGLHVTITRSPSIGFDVPVPFHHCSPTAEFNCRSDGWPRLAAFCICALFNEAERIAVWLRKCFMNNEL